MAAAHRAFGRRAEWGNEGQRPVSTANQDLCAHPHAARPQLALARLLLRRGALLEASHHLAIAAEQPDGATARPLLRRVQRLLSVL